MYSGLLKFPVSDIVVGANACPHFVCDRDRDQNNNNNDHDMGTSSQEVPLNG